MERDTSWQNSTDLGITASFRCGKATCREDGVALGVGLFQRDSISLSDPCLLASYCGNWDIARNECVSTVPFVPFFLEIPIRLAGDS